MRRALSLLTSRCAPSARPATSSFISSLAAPARAASSRAERAAALVGGPPAERSTYVNPRRVHPQWKPSTPQHPLWRPDSWMGAYYKLREADEAAMRNRDKLMGKRAPKRGRFIVSKVEDIERAYGLY